MASTPTQELQNEFLSTIRKSQAAVVDALQTWASAVQSITPELPDVNMPFADKLPKPQDLIAGAYDFAEQLLASQRKFAEDLLKAAAPLAPGRAESAPATETYKPGQVVPRDGTVECARHHDVQNHVKAGTRFAPCSHHHEHSEGCTWQYV